MVDVCKIRIVPESYCSFLCADLTMHSSPNNTVNITTAHSTNEKAGFEAELAVDGDNDTCFETATDSRFLLLTLARETTVIGVSMMVDGKISPIIDMTVYSSIYMYVHLWLGCE